MRIRAFSLLEVLVTLGILALLAYFFVPQLPFVREQADLTVARRQAERLQESLDSWLLKSPSVAQARGQFGAGTGDYPADVSAMLELLKPYLSDDSQSVYLVDSVDTSRIVTEAMREHGWYMRLRWTGSNWVANHPRVEFFSR